MHRSAWFLNALRALPLLAAFSFASLGEAQRPTALPPPPVVVNPETAPRPRLQATRTTGVIVVDGKLDEPAWAAATVLTNFVQQLPNTGQLALFRTEVRVLYDDDHLYISGVNYDPQPEKAITVGLERDFVSTNSDIFDSCSTRSMTSGIRSSSS